MKHFLSKGFLQKLLCLPNRINFIAIYKIHSPKHMNHILRSAKLENKIKM